MRVCMVDGCGLKHFGRGYCRNHYERWKRNGDTELRIHRGPCTVEGCQGRVVARKMCKRHYRRWQKYGDPLAPRQPMKRKDPYERWVKFVQKAEEEDGCWLWTGNTNNGGYGIFWYDDRTGLAHRWSYEHHKGPLGRLHVDHLCRNRLCVNPSHLEKVTARENLLRGETAAAANAAKTHCPQGHPYSEDNTYVDNRNSRSCITCRKAADKRRREAKRLEREQLK
jgi:hypothetical protein